MAIIYGVLTSYNLVVLFSSFSILYKRLTISAVAPFLLKTWDLKQNKKKNNVLFTFNHRLVNKLNYSLLAELEEEYSSFQVLMDCSLWAFMMNTNWARKKSSSKIINNWRKKTRLTKNIDWQTDRRICMVDIIEFPYTTISHYCVHTPHIYIFIDLSFLSNVLINCHTKDRQTIPFCNSILTAKPKKLSQTF